MLTYYDMLGVKADASEQDIKAAYRKLVKQYHPDRSGGGAARSEEDFPTFHDVTEAYQVLKDPEKRAAYDRQLRRSVAVHEPEAGTRRSGRTGIFVAGVSLGVAIAALVFADPRTMLSEGFLAKTIERAPGAGGEPETASRAEPLKDASQAGAADHSASPASPAAPPQQTAAEGDRVASYGKGSQPAGDSRSETVSVAAKSDDARPATASAEPSSPEASQPALESSTPVTGALPERTPAEETKLAEATVSSDEKSDINAAEELAMKDRASPAEEPRAPRDQVAALPTGIALEARRAEAWATASKSGLPYAFQAYLKSYPQGPWSDEARERLRRAGFVETPVGESQNAAPAWIKPGDPRAGRFRDCEQCPDMIAVPAGRFEHRVPRWWTGMRGGRSATDIRIGSAFAVSRSEVTAREWAVCVADGACRAGARSVHNKPSGDAPVTAVNWHDANDYAAWLTRRTGRRYRLISEAEWEYVARAGGDAPFHWGATASLDPPPYRDGPGGRDGAAYGRVSPPSSNAWGFVNLDGNIVEWVADCWMPAGEGLPADGRPWLARDGGDCARRVLKGGSWVIGPRRKANRFADFAEERDIFTGFRVARDF